MCLAVPGKIVSIQGSDPVFKSGRIDFGGVVREASLACVPEARVGDYVLVHAGMAISIVDQDEADQIFDYLRQMGDLAERPPESGADLRLAEEPG